MNCGDGMKIAIVGRTHWLLDTMQRLMEAGHTIVCVITAPAATEYQAREEDFEALALEAGAVFLKDGAQDQDAMIEIFKSTQPDIAISINWPKILGNDVCALPTHGVLNAHAGDLPRYRGNACPNWAILADEPHIGLCVHAMAAGEVDSGPIYARTTLTNSSDLYIQDVYHWMDETIPEAFTQALTCLADPEFVPIDQAKSLVTPLRCHPRRAEDGAIDWIQDASSIQRLIRASSRPFAGAFAQFENQNKVTIWRARVAELDYDVHAVPGQIIGRAADGAIRVACGSGVLEIEEAECSNGASLSASNRYRLTAGK